MRKLSQKLSTQNNTFSFYFFLGNLPRRKRIEGREIADAPQIQLTSTLTARASRKATGSTASGGWKNYRLTDELDAHRRFVFR